MARRRDGAGANCDVFIKCPSQKRSAKVCLTGVQKNHNPQHCPNLMIKKLSMFIGLCFMTAVTGSVRAQSYSNAVMALNPVAYWPLQETTPTPNGYYVATNLGTAGVAGNGYYQTWYQ